MKTQRLQTKWHRCTTRGGSNQVVKIANSNLHLNTLNPGHYLILCTIYINTRLWAFSMTLSSVQPRKAQMKPSTVQMFKIRFCRPIIQNLHEPLPCSRCPSDKFQIIRRKILRFKIRKSPVAPSCKLAWHAPWENAPLAAAAAAWDLDRKLFDRLRKMFRRRTDVDSQPYDRRPVTCGSNISFSQIFLSGCQEISVWSETNPVNRFVCVSFGRIWVWHNDTNAARGLVLITTLDVKLLPSSPSSSSPSSLNMRWMETIKRRFKRKI